MPDSVDQILTRLQPGKFDAVRAANFDVEAAQGALTADLGITRLLNFNEQERTADFAFATDQPIEHWFGMLTLDVSKKAVDLSRVEEGVCPFLVNHDRDDQVGVVVPGSVELGPIIRGKVKFSRSARGQEILDDVRDEIRNGTSIGLVVQDMQLENEKEVRKGAIPMYRATKWTMLENSVASIPADIACGAGRSFEKPTPSTSQVLENDPANRETAIPLPGERQMPNNDPQTPETPVATATPAATPAAASAVARTREIVEFAEIFGQGDLARTMIAASSEVTLEDVRVAIRNATPPSTVVPPEAPAAQAQRQGGVPPQAVQLARSLPRYGTLKSFTGEDAAERAHRFGQWIIATRGISAGINEGGFERAAKFCRDNGIVLTRAMSEGVNESGGFLVPEEFGNDLIDLREQYGVFRRNAKMVPMSSDTRSDPRRTGGLTAYFAGEGDALTASDKAWDRVELTAKKLTILSRYSNELNEDAVINLGDDLAGEIAYAFALKEDQCGFIGDGTSTYGGMQGVSTKIKGLSGTIANIAGLVVGAGNAYSELVLADFEGVAAKLPVYADTPRAKWYCHKSVYWNVMVKLALAAGGSTGAEATQGVAKRFLGYDVEFVQVMPSVEANSQVCALLGDLSLAASFGSRRDTTIAVSEHSRFANDQLEIRGTERFDINVHDVGNASATAGLRVPGPIVGLITAAS
jgi:HK97 family phage major capsid protein